MVTIPWHPGCQGGIGFFANFYPLIDENQSFLLVAQISGQTIRVFGFWLCSTIADVSGASAHQLLSFWWLWACLMVNSFSSVNSIRSKFRGVTRRRRSRHLSSRCPVVSCQKLDPLQLVQLQLKLLFGELPLAKYRFNGQFFEYRYCQISLDAFFYELAVRFGVDCAVWQSYWNRLMALLTCGGATPSFRAM